MDTLKQVLFHNYANLSMAHAAIAAGRKEYGQKDYEIRSAMYRDLMLGVKKIRKLEEDDQFLFSNRCNYCGSKLKLLKDHVFEKDSFPGYEEFNVISACSKCIKSRNGMDLMEWMDDSEEFLPLMVVRRYFKLVYYYCLENDLMNEPIKEVLKLKLPFNIDFWPEAFHEPIDLKLTV